MKKQKLYTSIKEFKENIVENNSNYDSIINSMDFDEIDGKKVIHLDEFVFLDEISDIEDEEEQDKKTDELVEHATKMGYVIELGVDNTYRIDRNVHEDADEWLQDIDGEEG